MQAQHQSGRPVVADVWSGQNGRWSPGSPISGHGTSSWGASFRYGGIPVSSIDTRSIHQGTPRFRFPANYRRPVAPFQGGEDRLRAKQEVRFELYVERWVMVGVGGWRWRRSNGGLLSCS